MDEHEFQQARKTLDQCPCPFEKAILSSRCACANSRRLNIAEREAATCLSSAAQMRCVALLEQLYQNAQFALKLPHLESPLPHAKAMKVQCGGLLGLQATLYSNCTETSQVKNIDALVIEAQRQFGELTQLPYQEIVKFINHYQVRVKRSCP